MTPAFASRRVIVERLAVLEQMLQQIEQLPLADEAQFFSDSRNVYTAESCLRRGLEALLDIGRHILAKGYGIPAGTYKDVAVLLAEQNVINPEEQKILMQMAGYRNRLVHFYHEVSPQELYQICVFRLSDFATIQAAVQRWVRQNPERIDRSVSE